MATTIKTHPAQINLGEKTRATKSHASFWKMIEFNRYGIIPMLLIFVVCLSGIAAGVGAPGSALQLSMVAFPTAIMLSLVLAVAPMRAIFFTAIIAVILDLLVLII
jgi:hypothetical protein